MPGFDVGEGAIEIREDLPFLAIMPLAKSKYSTKGVEPAMILRASAYSKGEKAS